MNKIKLIIQREYLTRVRKKSFIVMTILGPLLMAAMMIVPAFLATMSDTSDRKIAVLDETGIFYNKLQNDEHLQFYHVHTDLNTAKENMKTNGDYALLYIPKTEVALPTSAIIYSEKQPNLDTKSYIRRIMGKEIEEQKLLLQINKLKLDEADREIAMDIPISIKTSINLTTYKLSEGEAEQKTYTEIAMVIGIFTGILIYFFIFFFGAQVMRGVIEEKTSRIIEVIISSVKPFQLMMGKIVGIGLVGLTQLSLWIVLTASIVGVFQIAFKDKMPNQSAMVMNNTQMVQGNALAEVSSDESDLTAVFEAISSINFGIIIFAFIFFFLTGYLLYAALFAAVGSAVDSEADTQQFMLPITIPLIFAMIMAQFIIRDPEGPVAFWLSIIPLTSPIIMMIRIPFGVPYTELALSMVLLVAGFLFTTWMAGRIYRTGILMYGKKPSYKDLYKWIKYKG
ncbi:MAG: ABC transporter permease [Bacteroidetes bacterium]|nr:ABC transporter permease [Bacteroidota bacterium]